LQVRAFGEQFQPQGFASPTEQLLNGEGYHLSTYPPGREVFGADTQAGILASFAPTPELTAQPVDDTVDSGTEAVAGTMRNNHRGTTYSEPGFHPVQAMVDIKSKVRCTETSFVFQ
jgi:hypothetical protein